MNSNGSGQDTVHNWEGEGSGHRCSELRMDVDEESGGGAVQGDSESEREEFDNEGSVLCPLQHNSRLMWHVSYLLDSGCQNWSIT